MFLLGRLEGPGSATVAVAIKDSDPEIRAAALRAVRQAKHGVISAIQALAHDPSSQVRRECAIGLRYDSSPEAPALWATLASQYDGRDRWYLEALGIAADKQWDAFLDAWLAKAGTAWDSAAGRELVWRSRARKTPSLLAKLISNPATGAKDRERYFHAFDFLSGVEKDAALLELITGTSK